MLHLLMAPFIAIFRHQQLLREFVARDIKGRFAGSFAGILWTVINPLATIIAYYFVFSLVLRVSVTVEDTGTDQFIIFFLAAFFPWTMFADTLGKSAGSIVSQSGLVTKVVFPVELIPVSSLFSAFIVNGMGFLIFLIYLAFSGFYHVSWLWLPVVIAIEMLFALGLALFFSAFSVFIRDTTEVLGIALMLWFFGTPIIYPQSMVPEAMKSFFDVNPMALFARCIRDILLRHQVDEWLMLKLFVMAVVLLIPCTWFFMRSKPSFGDVL